ncbi:MAG: C40 family peptidase [Elusimicrobia bacterium]|nr:C40 family peptidase [Elusimicrobiota bacterium]
MMKRLFLWLTFGFPLGVQGAFDVQFTPEGPVMQKTETKGSSFTPVEGLVMVPVTDLRRNPSSVLAEAALQRPYAVDPNQETQLLFGESVLILEVKGHWARVEAPDQAEFTHAGRWQGYPGWVLKETLMAHPSNFYPSAVVISRYGRVRQSKKHSSFSMELPMGSRVGVIYTEKEWVRIQGPQGEMGWMKEHDVRLDRAAPKKGAEVREAVLAAARQFIGEPYYWGGRTGHRKKSSIPSGVDCSGLVNLAYRSVALNAPRDAHEQFLLARPLEKAVALQSGDLVFLAKKSTPNQMVHVMVFEKKETLIEAVHEFNRVRRVSFKKKLGVAQKDLQSGQGVGDFVVRFGTFLE